MLVDHTISDEVTPSKEGRTCNYRYEAIEEKSIARRTAVRRDAQQVANETIGNEELVALDAVEQCNSTLFRREALVGALNRLGDIWFGLVFLL